MTCSYALSRSSIASFKISKTNVILRFYLLLLRLLVRSVSSCVKRQFYRNAIPIALQLRTRATDPRGKGGAAQWHSPCAFTRLSGVGTAQRRRTERRAGVCLQSGFSLSLSLVSDFDGLTCGTLVCNCGG